MSFSRTLQTGMTGGILAGAIFLAGLIAQSALIRGDMLHPLRLFASIAAHTKPSDLSLGNVIVLGIATNFVLCSLYGCVVAAVLYFTSLFEKIEWTLVVGGACGLVLWLAVLYAAPYLGAPWFRNEDDLAQAVWFVLFGITVACYLAASNASHFIKGTK